MRTLLVEINYDFLGITRFQVEERLKEFYPNITTSEKYEALEEIDNEIGKLEEEKSYLEDEVSVLEERIKELEEEL